MTRIGTDIKFIDGVTHFGGPLDTLREVAALGLEGVNVRTLDEIAPTLDRAFLTDFAQLAAELELYVQMGVGKVNPYMTAELPRVRALGDGSYLAGMARLLTTCAEFGWTETWTAVGGFKPYPGIFFTDRFRTDAAWEDQLAAIERFLHRLAPVLRDTGVRLNLETHEEITTFELLRLIESVGDDVLGVCLDPANLAVRAEVPLEGIARIAPYVHTTQLRDAALWRTDVGLSRFIAPCGEGVIDWPAALGLVLEHHPALNLTIEPIGRVRAEMALHTSDPTWQAGHPDLTDAALGELFALAEAYEARAARGEAETLAQLRALRPDAELVSFLLASADHLRAVLAELPVAVAVGIPN
ncbi:sugar phosphate isomerase/epimerase family protein [Microbacterium trichothecenolyticum]|uniref:sugar phosphate isomerase/epimerase family protein n=1 Tax=Microbacterium trichothecenolyticum TaxID=69370 RepID=UPI0035BEA47A